MTGSPLGVPTAASVLRPWTALHRAVAGRPEFAAGRNARFAVLLALLCVLAAPYAFFNGFTEIQAYDDEGTLMITFRDLAHGLRLYDDVYALYGPFYYLTVGSLFTKLHVPLTHDAVRLVSTVFRLACSGVLASLTYRLTRSMLGGAFTFLACVLLLEELLHSPTHPQEICLLLASLLPHLVLSVERRPERATGAVAAVGAILAALLLTKINMGAFAALALAFTALRATPTGTWPRLATALAACAGLLLPLALMLPLFHLSWVAEYWAFATLTIGAALTTHLGTGHERLLTPRHWAVCLGALALTLAATLGLTLALGSSPYAMLDAVVLQNGRLIRNWYYALPISPGNVALAAAAAALALGCRVAVKRPGMGRAADAVPALLKLTAGTAGTAVVVLAATGMLPWFRAIVALFDVLMPFSFLVLTPAAGRDTVGAGRASLGLLAAFMVLYAFPVAGTQLVIAEVLMVCALPVLLIEGAADLRSLFPGPSAAALRPNAAAGWLACAVLLGTLAHQTRHAWWSWGGEAASGLPGASLIHLSPSERARTDWVLRQVASCPAFYTFPGMLSLYFWTGRPSPTALNNNDALGLLSASQQERVVADLARQPGLCIVAAPEMLRFFDRGQLASRPPLLRYVEDNFAPVAERGSFQILARKPDQRTVP
jgi:hypothetical protein